MVHTAMIFDTLQDSKKLTTAGFTPIQAEAQAEALKEVVEDNLITRFDKYATKSDLEGAVSDLENAVNRLENKLENSLKELELRMTIKLGGMLVAGIGSLIILMKLFRL